VTFPGPILLVTTVEIDCIINHEGVKSWHHLERKYYTFSVCKLKDYIAYHNFMPSGSGGNEKMRKKIDQITAQI